MGCLHVSLTPRPVVLKVGGFAPLGAILMSKGSKKQRRR